MNRPIRILSRLALCAALASGAHAASAQQYGPDNGPGNQNGQYVNGRNDQGGGVLPLPQGVRRVVGIDAQNVLLAELEPEVEGGPSEYRAIPVRHVYVGGIAKLFGGTTISTEEFVSPAYSKNGGRNGNGQNGFNGSQNGQNGFNPNGFNPNTSFGSNPNGFNPNGGYPNGGYPNGTLGYGYPSNGGVAGSNFGGFSSAPQVIPQVTYGVGNLIRSRQLPSQNGGYTIQQGQ